MICQLSRKEINDHRWNECIEQSPDGQAFFYTWYLDTCCPGWSALVEGDYEAVFPMAQRQKLGITYLYQPYFTRHFGVIAKKGSRPKQQGEFIASIPATVKYIDICLHHGHSPLANYSSQMSEKTYQVLFLGRAYADIHKGYHTNLIRNLRKAVRNGYVIREDYQAANIVNLFKAHQKTQREEFNDADYNTLLQLMEKSAHQAVTCSYAVLNSSGQADAGAFFINKNNKLLYLKGFSSPEGKKNGAMHFLFDHIIKMHAGRSLTLDFGGSSVKSVARFYHSFGSTDCLYLRLKINRLPAALRWIKR